MAAVLIIKVSQKLLYIIINIIDTIFPSTGRATQLLLDDVQ